MSALVIPVAANRSDLETKVRDRIAAGAPVWEIEVEAMPLWLLKGIEAGAAPIRTVFMGPLAGLVVHADGSRTLRACPEF